MAEFRILRIRAAFPLSSRIHLNPVRSRLAVTLEALDWYPWTGHAVLLGNHTYPAQDTDFVLALFGASATAARDAYRKFVHESAHRGQPCDLDGGGLRRSLPGWRHHGRLSGGGERWTSDGRVLGTTEFVRRLLGDSGGAGVAPAKPAALIQPLVAVVCAHFGVAPGELGSRSLRPGVLAARAALSYAAVMHHGLCPSLRSLSTSASLGAVSAARNPPRANGGVRAWHSARRQRRCISHRAGGEPRSDRVSGDLMPSSQSGASAANWRRTR